MIPSTDIHTSSDVEATWFLSGQVTEDKPVRKLPLMPLPFTVGRLPIHPLCLLRGTVSGNHAELRVENDELILRDLASTNGTFVNAKRIRGEVIVRQNDLIQFADVPFRIVKEDANCGLETINQDVSDKALTLVRFDALMSERNFDPHFQPIVSMHEQLLIGFEILGRSEIFGLESPAAMFQAASYLNMESDLSRALRLKGVEVSLSLGASPHVFINTHPAELDDFELIESLRTLRDVSPDQAITLEIHEAACTSPTRMKDLRRELRQLKMSLAYDDFGAGQTRLLELVEVPPDFLKFDMGLLRGIDKTPATHRQMVGTLVNMVREMDVAAIAEGIENEAEAAVCRDLGFDYAQGYYFGRPKPASCMTMCLPS